MAQPDVVSALRNKRAELAGVVSQRLAAISLSNSQRRSGQNLAYLERGSESDGSGLH
jgi:hypothetical protein